MSSRDVWLLDYVAGNVRSLINAIEFLGYNVKFIKTPQDIAYADRLILPGVGHFGHCLTQLRASGFADAILEHIRQDKPFFGICVGLQALFESSEEAPVTNGFGLVPGSLQLFDSSSKAVPHIGWNSANPTNSSTDTPLYGLNGNSKYYYVHSYAVPYVAQDLEREGWTVALGSYGNEKFVGAIAKGNLLATQFHPEKSGAAGLRLIESFLAASKLGSQPNFDMTVTSDESLETGQLQQGLTRRVIACLDVRSNEIGDLVVTKGDQYDVHDRETSTGGPRVRNMGKPIALAQEYYYQGADEITFLNITSFRNCPVADLPMLEILRKTSETVFVPLTVGGGIQDTKDLDGRVIPALEVATLYFKSGADKVSIGSDAVYAAEALIKKDMVPSGSSAIETISATYGRQAVVVSIDPTRVYVRAADDTPHNTIRTKYLGPQGEAFCWYQCTVKGGREKRDLDVVQLARAVEKLGAGELLLNCIDRDGSNRGFDLELITHVKSCVSIPVIASSGAGAPEHFVEVFGETGADAALGAGMFHRREYTIGEVKKGLAAHGFLVRPLEAFAHGRPDITKSG